MDDPFIFDLETRPDYDALARLRPFREEFDPSTVNTNRLSKPESIAKRIEEAREAWDETPIEDRRRDHFASVAKEELALLTPHLCHVGAVSFWTEDDGDQVRISDDEVKLVAGAMDRIASTGTVIGWNITGFDLPLLEIRARLLGVPVPMGLRRGRYYAEHVVDLMTEWGAGQTGRDHRYGLKKVAIAALGMEPVPGDGKHWHLYDVMRQEAYCRWDIEATRRAAEKLGIIAGPLERVKRGLGG